jgi:hypothetical protein
MHRAGRALDQERSAVALAPELLEAVHGHLPRRDLELLPRAGALVGLAPLHADGRPDRRALEETADRQGRIEVGDAAGVGDLALGIAGGRDRAQSGDGHILLWERHEEPLHAPRAAHEHEEQPRGERIERPCVPGLADAEGATRGEGQVV